MEKRDSFVFYRSFYQAVSQLKPKDQTEVILAICAYALDGSERELTGVPSAIFTLIKPNLDANRKKFESGKKGGRKKSDTDQIENKNHIKPEAKHNQTETKPEANHNQRLSEMEPKQNLMSNDLCMMSNELCMMTDEEGGSKGNQDPVLAVVMRAYLDKINPTPSQASLEELQVFAKEMGEACCLRAFDIALDAKKANWPYIRGILRAKLAQGVRCLADWDAAEEKREKDKPVGKPGQFGGETDPERVKAELAWMDQFLEAGEQDG